MKKKNKFIFLADGYRGGANTFLFYHMKYLNKNNQNVFLIDKDPKKTFPDIDRDIKTYKIDVFKEKNKKISILKKIINSDDKIKKYIVFTNFFIFIKYYWFFQKIKNNQNQIVLTIHSGILEMNIKRFFASLIFSIIYLNIDYLFFGSYSAKSWWKSRFPWMSLRSNLIHYNGVEIKNKNRSRLIKNKFQVSFAGRLEKENNPYFFINIALEYLKKNKDVIFNIYGNGSLLEELRLKYSSDKIVFHGWVDQKVIYKFSNLMIITSPLNNYPYVALEAKSYGIPVISCSKGDISKIIHNGIDGFIKYTNSQKEIVNLIKKIKKDYKKFSNNSFKISKNFEANKSCKSFWESIHV